MDLLTKVYINYIKILTRRFIIIMKYTISSAVMILLGLTTVEAETCKVLALSGGGQSSVFQAGALQGILDSTANGDTGYDIVTGVAGGAINAALLVDYSKGEESSAIPRMKSFWQGTATQTMYQEWLGGLLDGLLLEGGLYDDSNLKAYIQTTLKDVVPKREFDIGVVDLLSGKYDTLTKKDLDDQTTLDKGLISSLSFAGYFPPADDGKAKFYDGASVWNINIFPGINYCLE